MLSWNALSYFLVQIVKKCLDLDAFTSNADENVFLVFAWKAHTKCPHLLRQILVLSLLGLIFIKQIRLLESVCLINKVINKYIVSQYLSFLYFKMVISINYSEV